jgi:hypothetical protein
MLDRFRRSLVPSSLALLATLPACSSADDPSAEVDESSLTSGTPLVSGIGGKCLDDANGATSNGNKIQIHDCTGGASQAWTYRGGTFVGPGGKCLDILSDHQVPGTLVDLYACNGTKAQQWSIDGAAIKSTSGLCLDVRGGVDANGAQVQIATCYATPSQVWRAGQPPDSGAEGGAPRPSGGSHTGVDVVMEEALGPFPSWGNAMTGYHARGDGKADDTAALQAGLDALSSGDLQVFYLPAGTYKITKTLIVNGLAPDASPSPWGGFGIIGADPATTTIEWAGPAGGVMLAQNGGLGHRYNRLTWNGEGTAGVGVAHWWNQGSGRAAYGGSSEHQDEVFENMTIGIMAGRRGDGYGQGDSEGQVRRVVFKNCSYAGFDSGEFNAEDWWIFDSQFINDGRGASNNFTVVSTSGESLAGATASNGAGNFFLYRSLFQGSTVADFDMGNTGWMSMHHNVSLGSKLFLNALGNGGTAPFIVEGNRVAKSGSATPISFGDNGPLMLVDNEVAVGAGGSEYSVKEPSMSVLSLGNRSSALAPKAAGTQRLVSVDDTLVAESSISTEVPVMPGTPAVSTHVVYEVPSGATTAQIQALIDEALTSFDSQPIVHFAKGTWEVDETLKIPPKSKVQLVGDGWLSILRWSGSNAGGPVLRIGAPSKVTVRDMQWRAGVSAIQVTAADNPGGRVQIVGSRVSALEASNLTQTQLSMQANPGAGSITLTDVDNAVSIGNTVGPLAMTGGSFVMADTWYEGSAASVPNFAIKDATFTYMGGHESPASHGGTQTVPIISLDKFVGTASWFGLMIDVKGLAAPYAVEVENNLPGTHAYFMSNTTDFDTPALSLEYDWFKTGTGGDVGFLNNLELTTPYADQGDTSPGAITKAWAQERALTWDTTPYVPPAGATDIKLYRMKLNDSGAVVIDGK